MPANKITLGVPAYVHQPFIEDTLKTFSSYGYLQKSTATGLKDRRSLLPPPGRRTSIVARDYVTVYNDNGGSADGQIMFESLISQGAIALDGSGSYVGAGGFIREWDTCSSTVRLHPIHPVILAHLVLPLALVKIEPIRPDRDIRRPTVHVAQGPIRRASRSEGL